ncbi:uncharacterized protein LOC118576637 isoform X2 [Onychomys torridus]|uniref:uncharacterized protein LOC118576637 isoform X2 n=1 Tax=Onychomys torridus TaxID=38674 RepID=UPI00167F756A|nr:uncharacterized protein LOC118576637 isoform X2 [Onychomys torridus]
MPPCASYSAWKCSSVTHLSLAPCLLAYLFSVSHVPTFSSFAPAPPPISLTLDLLLVACSLSRPPWPAAFSEQTQLSIFCCRYRFHCRLTRSVSQSCSAVNGNKEPWMQKREETVAKDPDLYF